ncbi:MFS transporter [Streptomyces luteoverticillatus]|uniref:MFS transporter n=1 Tax=Streptomyces luteoverticillatus TaxID=66425 RepID=A0A3S9PDB0_STRLT|nr:MFS transporter [Streptomyces luteoverticillatus]AZQ70366.1 MFS transporter [Streptomyces luteoverticillatus]
MSPSSSGPLGSIGFGPRFVVPIVIGSMLNPVNSTMISTALVPIGRALGTGAAGTAWLVSGLYAASAVAQPAMGKVADRYGPRRVYAAGLVLVALAGLVALRADSLGELIAVRVALGVGTSAAYPAAMAMIRAQSARLRREPPGGVLGALTVAGLASAAVGPALGGLLTGLAGWRAIFVVNAPLAAVGLLLTLAWLPQDTPRPAGERESAWTALDPLGATLFAGVTLPAVLFLMRLDHPRWSLLALGGALAAALVAWELRARRPFLDLRMLAANRPLVRTYIRYATAFLVLYCVLYGYAQWLEESAGRSTTTAGLLMLPMSVVAAVASWLGSRRKRVRAPLLLGTGAMVVATGVLLCAGPDSPVVLLVVLGALFGLPNGLNAVGNQTALYAQAPAEQTGTAAGLFRTAQYTGAIAASSLIGLFYGDRASTSGLHSLALVLGALSALLLVATLADRELPRGPGDAG